MVFFFVSLCASLVRSADPNPQPSGAVPAAAAAVDLDAFKKELQKHIQNQYKQWTENQGIELADYITSQLQTQLDGRFTPTTASKILDSIEFHFQVQGASRTRPEAMEVQKQTYRWAIARFAARQPMLPQQVEDLKKSVKDAFSELMERIKKETTTEQSPLVAKHSSEQQEITLKVIDDELDPGMKKSFSKEQLREFIEKAFKQWKRFSESPFKRPGSPKETSRRLDEVERSFLATNLLTTVTNKYIRVISADSTVMFTTNRFADSPKMGITWAFITLSSAMRSVDVEPDEPLQQEIKRYGENYGVGHYVEEIKKLRKELDAERDRKAEKASKNRNAD